MAEKILKIEYDEGATVEITVKPAEMRKLSFGEFETAHKFLTDLIVDCVDAMRDSSLSAAYQGYLYGKMEMALNQLYADADKAGISPDDVKMAYDALNDSPVYREINTTNVLRYECNGVCEFASAPGVVQHI